MVACDLIRHTVFMLVSTLGFIFTNFYDEVWKALVEDFSVRPIKNHSSYPDDSIVNVIKNSSNLTDWQQEEGGTFNKPEGGVCQLGYEGNRIHLWNKSEETWLRRYNKSDVNGEIRFQCMRVALDAIHWFVVCVDEQDKAPRHWDQSQIEHIYSWLLKSPDVGLIDLHPGNGFYALAAGALNRTSTVIGNQPTSLQRIQKGIIISGLSQKVHLYEHKPSKSAAGLCPSNTDQLLCQNGQNNSSFSIYKDILGLNPPQKAILRVKLDKHTVGMLLQSQVLFKHLCIPFVIWEIDQDLDATELVSLIQLADTFISDGGYRPFTYNGIALALNNIADWPKVVYWKSSFMV